MTQGIENYAKQILSILC